MTRSLRRAALALALLAAAGCSVLLGIDGDVVDPQLDAGPEAGALVLTAAPSSIPLRQGGSATIAVTAKPSGGTNRLVQVTVAGLSPSITASPQSFTLTEGATQSFKITADDVARIGDYAFTLQATADAVPAPPVALTAHVSGNVDPTFGDAGVAFVPFGPLLGSADREPFGLAIDGSDRIYVAFGIGGIVDGGSTNVRPLAVARLTADGVLDPTFADAGYATAAIDGGPSPNQRAAAMALMPNGTIILLGKSIDVGVPTFGVVAALDANGALIGGDKITASAGNTSYGAAAVESALGVIAAGEGDDGIASRVDVLDGRIDPAYADAGVAVVKGKDKRATVCNDVLVIGSRALVTCKAGPAFDLVALTSNGALDTTFGAGGSALAASLPGAQEPWSTIVAGERLFQIGVVFPPLPQAHGVAIRALTMAGGADPTFADGGIATFVPQRADSTGAQAFSGAFTDAGVWVGGMLEVNGGTDRRGLVLRIDPATAALDKSFALDGVSSPTSPDQLLVVRRLATQRDRVVAGALVGKKDGPTPSWDVVLFRYLP